jgi:hypothetical protein
MRLEAKHRYIYSRKTSTINTELLSLSKDKTTVPPEKNILTYKKQGKYNEIVKKANCFVWGVAS